MIGAIETIAALPAAVLVVDAIGVVRALNPAAERLFGLAPCTGVGRPVTGLLELPCQRAWSFAALAADPATPGSVAAIGRRGDGATFAASIRAAATDDGHVLVVDGQPTAEVPRPSADERVRRLLEVVRVIPWEADLTTNQFTWVGPQAAAILGYPAADWYTPDFWPRHMHPDDRDQALTTCAGAAARTDHYSFDYRMIAADGRVVWICDIVAVTRLGDHPRLLTGYMLDVTEVKDAERARTELLAEAQGLRATAEAALRLRDEFLSIAAHELYTPISSLLLIMQSLPDAFAPGERWSKTRQIALRQTRRLEHLSTELLDVARIEAGRLELHLEPIDLADLGREIVERHELDAEQAGSTLSLEAEPTVGSWDRSRLDQVITNLLRNALKFGKGTPIALVIGHDGTHASLTVTDRGIGIPPDRLELIFEPFERAVSARAYGGFGMGLYIARRVVAAHAGTIRATSEPGAGATFTVELPLVSPAG